MANIPKIGIFPEVDGVGSYFETPTYYCYANYIHAIQGAGGVPLIIPQELDRLNMESVLKECDGICLVGGPGILKGLDGELPSDLRAVEDRRILPEIDALSCCKKNKIPVLGICYGMQLMNVFQGGTLHGDLHSCNSPKILHSPKRNNGRPVEHPLYLSRHVKDPMRWRFLDGATVNSFHLQAVKKLGQSFECAASSRDGIPEVIESAELSWMGCQFHPERCAQSIRKPIFELFLRVCSNGKRSPGSFEIS